MRENARSHLLIYSHLIHYCFAQCPGLESVRLANPQHLGRGLAQWWAEQQKHGGGLVPIILHHPPPHTHTL